MLFARFLAETESSHRAGIWRCDLTYRVPGTRAHESAGLDRTGSRLCTTNAAADFPALADPVLEALALPPETRSALEDLMKGLPGEVFFADDSLGWVYQYWQADRKESA